MSSQNKCPKCDSSYVYQDGPLWVCPECSHEWSPESVQEEVGSTSSEIKDANGNLLADGDSVSVIKDLKVKGSSLVVKVGTKVKGIRLIEEADDGHDIACKVPGIGQMNLKSEFVKKV